MDKQCAWCGGPATVCSQDETVFACQAHVMVLRGQRPYGIAFKPIPEKPAERRDRLYRDELKPELARTTDDWQIAYWSIEKGQDTNMKAQSVKQAELEGKDFAQLLRAIIGGTSDYKTVTKFAQYVAR